MVNPILSALEVWFSYPRREPALSGVSLDVYEGDFLALCGQNGSGKTTLAKHFMGLLRPSSGQVLVEGTDIARRATVDLASTIGYCYQNPDHQIFASTVGAEIEFGPKNLGIPTEEIRRRTTTLLDMVGLRDQADAYPFSLGRGQRQKLAVASVLAMEPKVLIVDEPTTGLDWRGGKAMMDTMRLLNESGRTIVIITHDMNIVAEYSRRVVVMAGGRKLADGSPVEVFGNSAALASAALRAPQAYRLARARPGLFSTGTVTIDQARADIAQRAVQLPAQGIG